MNVLNPKLILDHINKNEKTFDELLKLLGNPNSDWLHFHIKMWRNKGKLDIISNGNKIIIKKRIDIK